jgi:acetyltransferase
MAGKDFLYNGLFRQAGIIRVYSVEDLYGIGWALATQPRIRGNRIGIITNSGGPGSAIADTLDANGCDVPLFSEALKTRIKPLIPEHAPCGNPVDLTFALDMDVMTRDIPDLVMNSGEVDGIIMHGAMSTGWMTSVYPHLSDLMPGVRLEDLVQSTTRDLSESVQMPFKNNMPMTVSAFFDRVDQYTREYEDSNVPVFDSPEKAARAMATLVKYKQVQDRTPAEALPELAVNDQASEILARAAAEGRKSLDEFEAKQVLAAYGVPVPREILCQDAESALAAAEQIGFPVVVKACDSTIFHKTDQGLVVVNISDRDGVAAAVDALQKALDRPVPVLVAEMIKGQREFLAGITFDEQFGHCVAFGMGGIFTEALNDIIYRVGPLTETDAEEMAADLAGRKLLKAYRGMPPVDMSAMAKILSVLSRLPEIHPEIREIDINPLLCRGADPVAVDALIVLR